METDCNSKKKRAAVLQDPFKFSLKYSKSHYYYNHIMLSSFKISLGSIFRLEVVELFGYKKMFLIMV